MSYGFVVMLDSWTVRQTDSQTDNHIQDTDVLLEKFIQNYLNSVILTLGLTDVTKAAETMITAAGLQVCVIFQLVLISFAVVLAVDCRCCLLVPASQIWRLHGKMKGQSLRLAS